MDLFDMAKIKELAGLFKRSTSELVLLDEVKV